MPRYAEARINSNLRFRCARARDELVSSVMTRHQWKFEAVPRWGGSSFGLVNARVR